ncbi:MAG: choice-of-anchor Q domain-containing protein [Chthoniobacterales bacterium]
MSKILFPAVVAVCFFTSVAFGATLTVTNINDNGAGSLRAAVTAAVKGDTITFDSSLNGKTIILTGGEIALSKTLSISGPGAANLTISGNHSSRIFNVNAVSTISGLTLTSGQTSGDGGAVIASFNLTLTGVTFTGNHSANNGGAIAGRFAAAFIISDCTFSNNTAEFLSGALYTDGKGNSIARTTFSNNIASDAGLAGAVFNEGTMVMDHCTVSGNSAGGEGSVAGGIYSDSSLTLIDSTIDGNSTGPGGMAGGLYNAGTLLIRNSTVSRNVIGDATPDFEAQGAGIFNEPASSLTVVNSTIAGNTGGGAAQGGGMYNQGNCIVNNSTIAANTIGAGGTGGGIFNSTSGATCTVSNSVIAANMASSARDFSGVMASQGFNLIGDTTGSTGEAATDLINVDPRLGTLQNNGGSTQTMALLLGSPARDHGNPAFDPNTFTPPLTLDQRGNARNINGTIDIGSFEADIAHFPSIDSLTNAQTLECASYRGTTASINATVSDTKGHTLTVQWYVNNELKQTVVIPGTLPTTTGTSAYTATFPLGVTNVMLSVSDGLSEPVTQTTTVTVVDTTPPTIKSVCASPNVLSPPNHKMIKIKVKACVSDTADPSPNWKIISVSSNEAGDGQYQILGSDCVNLLSERNGAGDGRVYTIRVQATDRSGNSATKDVQVRVPKGGR